MSFPFDVSSKLEKKLSKLRKKDKSLAIAVNKKMHQVVNSSKATIEHFKNLRGNMSHLKRVHIKNFVLTFRIKDNTIIFEDFEHHDNIYKKP